MIIAGNLVIYLKRFKKGEKMKSMTGFGHAEGEGTIGFYRISIKSFNHRFSDINLRLPRELCVWEENLISYLKERVSRGKVELKLNFEPSEEAFSVEANSLLAKAYLKALHKLSSELNIPYEADLRDLMQVPEIIKLKEDDHRWLDEYQRFLPIFKEAVEAFLQYRLREGEKLQHDLIQQMEKFRELISMVEEKSKNIPEYYREKLNQRLKEIISSVQVNENLLAQEIVFYVDRSDIHEEIIRLKAHICRFDDILSRQDSIGRELEFVLQEMNREVNTIGSKTSNVEISSLIIDLKTVLEKMREQIQNVE